MNEIKDIAIEEIRQKYLKLCVILTILSFSITIIFFILSNTYSTFFTCGILMLFVSFIPYFYYNGDYKTIICKKYIPKLLKASFDSFKYKNTPSTLSYPINILRDLDITNYYSNFDVFDKLEVNNATILNITAQGLYFGKTRTSFHGQLIVINTNSFKDTIFLIKNNKIFYKNSKQNQTKWNLFKDDNSKINKLKDLSITIAKNFKCKRYRVYIDNEHVYIAIPSNKDLIEVSSLFNKNIKLNLDFISNVIKLNELFGI